MSLVCAFAINAAPCSWVSLWVGHEEDSGLALLCVVASHHNGTAH